VLLHAGLYANTDIISRGGKMDLVIRNGRVINPAEGIDSVLDVGISGNEVVSVSPKVEAPSTAEVIDASGCLVLPGLIDLHTHVNFGGGPWGINPDELGPRTGVTTMVDAGSTGAGNFNGLYQHVIKNSCVDIFAFLNIAYNGVDGCIYLPNSGLVVGELIDIRRALVEPAVQLGSQYPELIRGIKIRASVEAAGDHGLTSIALAQQAAERLNVPVMVHIGAPPPTRREILDMLRPCDILTHAFRGDPNSPLKPDSSIMPEMLEARERGVLFDIGHGCGSFAFEVGHALLEQGFLPDTISSDIHMFSIDGPAYDLPTTMSKFLALGMSLMDVIRATTIAPARAIGIQDHFGSLSIGKTADISIMKLEKNTLTFEDAFKQTLQANRKLVPITTIKNGKVIWPLISNGDA